MPFQTAQPSALRSDEGGTGRVGASRVILDTLVLAYEAGASPEEIRPQFPALILSDIYAAISYYLSHQSKVQNYLETRQAQAVQIRETIKAAHPTDNFCARLLARKNSGRRFGFVANHFSPVVFIFAGFYAQKRHFNKVVGGKGAGRG